MRKSTALVIWLTFAAVTAYLLFVPGNSVKVRKATTTHIALPVPTPEILLEHAAAIQARHRAMVIELRRQRARARALARYVAEERVKAAAAAAALKARLAAMDPRAIVDSLLPPVQAACLSAIFTRESGWKINATNSSSGAYGIPQALPGSKMASAGADWRTNPWTQIRWAIGYVDGRYGGACGAWIYWQAHSNY
jgi:hypothetical protein